MSLLNALAFGTSLRDGPNFSNPSVPISAPNVAKWFFNDGVGGAAKVSVNARTAMGLPAMKRAVDLISSDVARLPLYVYRRLEPEGKERATEHPAYSLLLRDPNRFQTAYDWKRTMVSQAMIKRGGFSYIVRDGAGRPIELLPLDPDSTTPVIYKAGGDSQLVFITRLGDVQRTLLAENVLHIKGFSEDGICGKSIIDMMREFLGTAIAQQRYAGAYYGQGAKVGGFLMFPGHINSEAAEKMTRDFNSDAGSLDKAHEVVLLEDGVKFQQASFNPRDSQFVEGQAVTNRMVGLVTGAPAHLLGDTETTPYASRVEANAEYLDHCLDPWLRNLEEQCWDKLLTEQEKRSDSHVVEFRRSDLLRMNNAEQASADAIYLDRRTILPNEVRNRMNLNPIEGGDVPLQPLNMQPATDAPADAPMDMPADPAPTDEPRAIEPPAIDYDQVRRDVESANEAARQRMLRRLATAAIKNSRRSVAFAGWLDVGMIEEHRKVICDALTPTVRALCSLEAEFDFDHKLKWYVDDVFNEFRSALIAVVNDHTPLSLPAQVREAVARYLPEEAA